MSEKLAIYDKEKTVKDLQDVNKEVDVSIRKFMELVNMTERASQGFSRATPREVTAAFRVGGEVMSGNIRITNELSEAQRRLVTINRNMTVQSSALSGTIAQQSERVRQLTAANREYAREQLRIEALSDRERQRLGNTVMLYGAVQQKLNKLQFEYKNLAIAKQLGITLTDKEIQRMEYLEARIKRYDQALKAVDASMGRHQRNVGNYASGYNGLNMSVAQLAREMPAFTYSVQTGFMALSNNIPIFMDSVRAAIAQNKALRNEGKTTVPVWKQVGLAVLGFNTILSIAITLMTVYGKEIGEWVKSLFQANGAVGILERSTKALNQARKEAIKSAASEVNTLEKLYRVSTSENASRESRIRAVNKLQSLYPSFFKNLSDETIMVGKAKDAYLRLRGAILDSARAKAIGNILEQRQQKKLEDEEKLNKLQNEQVQEALKLRKDINGSTSEFVRDGQGGLIKKDIDNSIVYKRTLNDINITLDKKRKLNKKYYEENKFLMDEQYKLENKKDVLNYEGDKNGKDERPKKPSSAQLTAAQKDYLNNLQAEKDNALAIQKEKWMNMEIDEKTYWENYIKIVKDYRDRVAAYLRGSNSKERQVEASARKRAIDELEKANEEIYDYEKKNLEETNKMKVNELERSASQIAESDYLTDYDRLNKQIAIDTEIINELTTFYDDQIDLAKKAGKSVLEWENKRDEEIGKIQDDRMKKMRSLPEAMVNQVNADAEALKLQGEITYEQQKRAILSNKRLSTEDKSFQLSVLDKQNQININNQEIERLDTLKGQLVLKRAINQLNGLPPILSPEDEQKLKELEAAKERLTTENDQNNKDLNLLTFDKIAQGLRPLVDLVGNSLKDLGLNQIADQFSVMYDKVLAEGKEFSLSNKEIFQAATAVISDFSQMFINKQKENSISALNEQLKHSQETTEQEIGFINQRLEYLNGLDELSKEQMTERNRLEDEARTYKEQQLQREKLIETQKAKAEQKAAAQQALINGALAATMTLAQMGFVAGAIPAALALAFGIAQSIAISSKNPVPQYFVGRKDGPAEWALTQERGRELITDKNDNVLSLGSSRGAKKTWLNKGDKVYTAKETATILKDMGSLPKLGQNVYRKAALQNIQAPVIIQNKQEDYSKKIIDGLAQKFESIIKRNSNPEIQYINGKIIQYHGSNNPVIRGKYDPKTGEEVWYQ
ncbi:hypothetical protein ATE47_04200 [Chryseobacterium sp. IHB B 17019]|uniref:hypothetical protein n=1 Tax=Chryseobacterium sp. IHB B 17019 TaxID=1721091 RepID=UPI0007200823|nr:hypothetical protein [Chryseobacterium sp. IHB B 17019]ALR29771.1 hypothetical protein ATE47_04200 [Chryseobacterium sp. IHB B 17019]